MKKRIEIENEALAYLYDAIMQSAPTANRQEVRKMNAAFKAVAEPKKQYIEAVNALRLKYRVEKTDAEGKQMKDQNGNPIFYFPDAIVEEVEKAMLEVATTKVPVEFDRETFSFLNSRVEGVFDRKDVKENGISGEVQMKMLVMIDDAFENATDI